MSKVSEFRIRKAGAGDIPVLIDFLIKLGLHVSGAKRQTLSRKAKMRLRDFLQEYIDDPGKHMVVACTGAGEIVGMGNIEIWHSPNLWEESREPEYKSGFLDDIWVEPAYRKQGVMAKILGELIDFAEKHHIEELVLEYAVSNKEAAGAWKRLGFTPTGVRASASTGEVRQKLSGA